MLVFPQIQTHLCIYIKYLCFILAIPHNRWKSPGFKALLLLLWCPGTPIKFCFISKCRKAQNPRPVSWKMGICYFYSLISLGRRGQSAGSIASQFCRESYSQLHTRRTQRRNGNKPVTRSTSIRGGCLDICLWDTITPPIEKLQPNEWTKHNQ